MRLEVIEQVMKDHYCFTMHTHSTKYKSNSLKDHF